MSTIADLTAFLAALAAGQQPAVPPAGPSFALPAETDFRTYVFAAYGAVLLLLLLFSLWSVIQVGGASRKLDHLKERLEAAGSPGPKERS